MSRHSLFHFVVFLLACLCACPLSAGTEPELVNIQTVDPTIAIELRYAGPRNVAQRPLYPAGMPALVRPSVAERLVAAQSYLQVRGFRLKIWDAYRPKAAHDQLWQTSRNTDYVADPADGLGSLHSWGVAVDATLVTEKGSEVAMPTDFDDFTPAAMLRYTGNDLGIRNHLFTLQRAMALAGFYGMRTEWWHFVAKDWQKYRAISDGKIAGRSFPAPPTPKAAEVASSELDNRNSAARTSAAGTAARAPHSARTVN